MSKLCPFGDKVAYDSEHKAKQVRNTLGSHANVQELRIYKCPNCFKYHFTSRKD